MSTKPPSTTPASPNCYPGSSDPRVSTSHSHRQLLSWIFRSTLPETDSSKPVWSDWDPSCPQPPRPTTLTPPTLSATHHDRPKCYPGSTDSRCPRPQQLLHQIVSQVVQTQGVPRLRRRSLPMFPWI
ncbi:hypothetical protein EVAR_46045_1 [Eumeta japonica]|uniref:Uncharacterized protein n=1 Tax=Eumeta variegata TaxID=151549 RepID=A0A4C1XDS7_EUMVA|nr:hypothetical protein EVAR_46045_1 [Eumeta japonica]